MSPMDFFDRGYLLAPDGICLTDGKREFTYRQARSAANRVAHALRRNGLGPGSVVAVYGHNHILTLVAVLGILKAGCVWMPLNVRNGRDEIAHALKIHDTSFVFYHSALEELVDPILADIVTCKDAVCLDRDAGHVGLERWIAEEPDDDIPLTRAVDDLLAIRATGGTTGPSKGVMITSRVYNTMYANMLACLPMRGRPVHLAAAPLSHASGTLCFPTFAFGGTNVILDKADPELILRAFQEHKVTHIFLPPTLVYMLLDSPKVRAFDYSSLQYIVYAGAPMSVDRLKDAMDVFGPVMAQGFGQAEAPFFCTILSPEDHLEAIRSGQEKRLASCGRPTPFTRVAVMDDEGRQLHNGETGEIVVQGDLVMTGYYNNPEATARVSQFGWHHTGDVGYRDENGFLYIVDRKRDLIISGGFNIAPSEIERVLWAHPSVGDCAVIGVPDERWGEAVKAVVELRPGQSVSEDELRDFCRDRLGGMKTPKSIEFWPQLPRSQVGKVLKRDVRAKFWKGQARQV